MPSETLVNIKIKMFAYPLPTQSITILVKPKLVKTKKCSKTLKVFFTIVLIILSTDFGFVQFKSPKTTFIIKSLCAVQSLVAGLSFIFFYCLSNFDGDFFVFWYCTYIFEYFVIVFVLLFKSKVTFFNFCNILLSIDAKIGKNKSFQPDCLIISWLGFILAYRGFLTFIYCTALEDYCIKQTYAIFLFLIPLLCVDIFLIVYFTIFYCLYRRLKMFTGLVRNGQVDIISCQCFYKSIADAKDGITSLFNPLYLVPLLFHTIDVMITLFYPVIQLGFGQGNGMHFTAANFSVVHVFLMLFSPAYAAGMLTSQVHRLRLVLHDQLLQERDKKQFKELKKLIRYVDVRPLKVTIWKVVSLDWQLPVIVFNICVTYLIVMLQFAYK